MRRGLPIGTRRPGTNGYVMVKVGVGHHLANKSGWATEHRVVMEEKLGRRLLPAEQVHHIDFNRENNAPANLEACPSIHHHRRAHNPNSKLRAPGEPNPMIPCECGCGRLLPKFSQHGRPQRFAPSHGNWFFAGLGRKNHFDKRTDEQIAEDDKRKLADRLAPKY